MAKKYRRAYVYSCNPVTREEIDKLDLDAEECWVSPDIVENPDGKAKTMYMSTVIGQIATCDMVYFMKGWDKDPVAATVNEIVRMYLESEGVKVVEDGYEEITLELTSKELENLRSMASAANMSVNRFVSFKLKSALADGTFERLAKNWKEENTEKAGG